MPIPELPVPLSRGNPSLVSPAAAQSHPGQLLGAPRPEDPVARSALLHLPKPTRFPHLCPAPLPLLGDPGGFFQWLFSFCLRQPRFSAGRKAPFVGRSCISKVHCWPVMNLHAFTNVWKQENSFAFLIEIDVIPLPVVPEELFCSISSPFMQPLFMFRSGLLPPRIIVTATSGSRPAKSSSCVFNASPH